MRKILVAVIVLAAIGAAGYWAFKRGAERALEASVTAALHRLPPDWEVTFAGLDVAPATRTVTFRNLVVRYRPQPDFELKAEEIAIVDPATDFGDRLTAALAQPESVAEDTTLAVAGTVKARGVAFKTTQESGSIASSETTGLRFYPWAMTRPGVPALGELPALLAKVNDQATPEELAPLLRLCAALFLSGTYDHGVVEGLSASGRTLATAALEPTDFTETIARLAADGVDRGVMQHAEASGARVTIGPLTRTSVDRVVYEGFDVRQPALRLVKGEAVGPATLDGFRLGRLEFSGMTTEAPAAAPATIGSFGLADIAVSKGMPISGRMFLTRLALSRDMMPDAESKEGFDKLGIDRATVSFSLAYDWDLAKKRVSVHDTSLTIDELGALELAVETVDAEPGAEWAGTAKLAHARLRYRDNSLVDRAFRAGAKEAGSDDAAFRAQTILGLQAAAAGFAGDPAAAEGVKQIVSFLGAPKTLVIELAPKEPVSFNDIEDAAVAPPADFPTRLGLKVRANE